MIILGLILITGLVAQPIIVPTDYATLDLALQNAQADDTIILLPGTHTTSATVNLDVTITSNYINSNDPDDIIDTILESPGLSGETVLTYYNCGGTLQYLTVANGTARGIEFTYCTTTLNYVHVIGNGAAATDGGGIYVDDTSDITISNCLIDDNIGYYGAGIYVDGIVVIENSEISNNVGVDMYAEGGGIYVNTDGELEISGSEITGNSTTYYGGGITVNRGEAYISECDITENSVYSAPGVNIPDGYETRAPGACGGGIYAYESTLVVEESSTINDNDSRHGGGICYEYENTMYNVPEVSITDSDVEDNYLTGQIPRLSMGAGIYIENTSKSSTPLKLDLVRTNIYSNSGATIGGGIYSIETNITINGGSVSSNTATTGSSIIIGVPYNEGGGIFGISNTDIFIGGAAIITNNEAGTNGGGIAVHESTIEILKGLVDTNIADDNGGGIYFGDDSEGDLTNLTLVDNDATTGSGIYSENVPVSILNSIIYYQSNPQVYYDTGNSENLVIRSTDIEDLGSGGITAVNPSDLIQTSNISITPEFEDYQNGDYTLDFISPCINAGCPTCNDDPDGSPPDLGYQYHYLTKGDSNDDDVLDILDIMIVISIILNNHTPYNSQEWTADYNDDSAIDILDQVALVDCIVEDDCLYRDILASGSYMLSVTEEALLGRDNGENWLISIDSEVEIGGLQLEFNYNPADESLEFIDLQSDISNMEFDYNDVDGQVIIVVYSNQGFVIPEGSNNILNLNFSGLNRGLVENTNPPDIFNVLVADTHGNQVISSNNGLGTPAGFALNPLYPNPFNPTTTISFYIPEDTQVSISIYDIVGREVAQLVNSEHFVSGSHSIVLDGSKLSSGIYLVNVSAGNESLITKAVLAK